jgi:hypothetical protein
MEMSRASFIESENPGRSVSLRTEVKELLAGVTMGVISLKCDQNKRS